MVHRRRRNSRGVGAAIAHLRPAGLRRVPAVGGVPRPGGIVREGALFTAGHQLAGVSSRTIIIFISHREHFRPLGGVGMVLGNAGGFDGVAHIYRGPALVLPAVKMPNVAALGHVAVGVQTAHGRHLLTRGAVGNVCIVVRLGAVGGNVVDVIRQLLPHRVKGNGVAVVGVACAHRVALRVLGDGHRAAVGLGPTLELPAGGGGIVGPGHRLPRFFA